MKMKKLTALALAGVLCLGMSTTAFAEEIADSDAPVAEGTVTEDGSLSPDDGDGDQTIEEAKKAQISSVTSNKPDKGSNATATDRKDKLSSSDVPAAYRDWLNSESEEAASKAIQRDLQDILENAIDKAGKITGDDKEAYDKTIEMMESLGLYEKNAYFEVITLDNLHYSDVIDHKYKDPDTGEIIGEKIKVRFDLDAEKLEEGQYVRLLHEVKFGEGANTVTTWEVFKYQAQWDPKNKVYYVEHDFTDFSPVAILWLQSDNSLAPGTSNGGNPTENPGNSSTDNSTLTPNGSGTITPDQLADLIAERLVQYAKTTTVVRTAASGKASPKTGE